MTGFGSKDERRMELLRQLERSIANGPATVTGNVHESGVSITIEIPKDKADLEGTRNLVAALSAAVM